jgi:aspartyl-tRNA(Asn)/glutamyl-tRNA(Gln) amidotransferase subunit B
MNEVTKDAKGSSDVVIGLEIHIQLKSQSKLFCCCPASYRDIAPNTNVCPTCTGQPGAKPFGLNKTALENLLKIALALNCKINDRCIIQRKHYFYPDLPTGFQRTSKPIGTEGKLGNIRIREVHIEEDPGRYELRAGTVDYNRAGVPLIEIVTEPDITSPAEARSFLEELTAILNYLGVARDEPGSMRVDANISISGGTRSEVKNINSFKGVFTALSYEIVRQRNILRRGGRVERETRHFDEVSGTTVSMRKKETEEDYRYMPDPDVPPLSIDIALVKRLAAAMPELPRAKAERFVRQYNIRSEDAWIIVSEIELADMFEEMVKFCEPKNLAMWIRGPLKKQLNYRDILFKQSGLKLKDLIELYDDFSKGRITDDGMEKALVTLLDKHISYASIRDEILVITDMLEIEGAIESILAQPQSIAAIEDYKKGNEKALNFIIGKIMKESKGRMDSKTIREIILNKIEKQEKKNV